MNLMNSLNSPYIPDIPQSLVFCAKSIAVLL